MKSKYDDFINFLDNVEQEYTQQASNRSHLTNKSSKANYSVVSEKADLSTVSISDPREAYSKVRERLLELEIEKEEQSKALELIKQIRQKEKQEVVLNISAIKEESNRTAEIIKAEMADRIEK